tara:strand:+ start:482 stop:1438 length:957 start_codon:yes stop_codon:yes gene_type:complete
MNLHKPKFWDFEKPNFLAYLLLPLTLFVRANIFISKLYPKKKFKKIKTICIGNIYLGGTGKTPTTLKLYQLLKNINYKVVNAKKYYFDQEDEYVLLKNKSNVITLRDRDEIIKHAIKKNYELVIFDDGLQEKKIDYDLKFVCFDSKNWIGNGLIIPSGPLREEINSLRKYDGVFLKVTNTSIDLNKIRLIIKNINPKIEVFDTYVKIKNIESLELSDKYLIFSGIGNSTSFKEILEYNNFNVVEEKIFADHYDYKIQDIQKILEISKNKDLKILTTEKDYIKIPEDLKSEINFIEIDLEIPKKDKLIKFVKSKIDERN